MNRLTNSLTYTKYIVLPNLEMHILSVLYSKQFIMRLREFMFIADIYCVHCAMTRRTPGARCDAARASVRRPPRTFCSPGIKGSFTTQPFSGPKTITLKRTSPRALFVNCPAFNEVHNNATAVCNPSNDQALRFAT